VLLIGTWRAMAATSLQQLKLKAAQQDESAPIIFVLMLGAIAASLVGVFTVIRDARDTANQTAIISVLLALATLILSWLCMHVQFATHYAHRYYGDAKGQGSAGSGLKFPEEKPAPSYMEFIYFSFCVGMTYQVSDIMTENRAFRRLVTIHGALSFFYNTFVLALAVNLFGAFSGSG
jgi:uncharacterized membrane protein